MNKDFENNFEEKFISKYENILIVFTSRFAEKLVEIPNRVASAIWVFFIEEDFRENFKNFYIPFNCRFFLISKTDEINHEIQDVYQISQNSSKTYSHFAIWKNNQLQVYEKDIFSKRMNLQGHKYHVALSNVSLLPNCKKLKTNNILIH